MTVKVVCHFFSVDFFLMQSLEPCFFVKVELEKPKQHRPLSLYTGGPGLRSKICSDIAISFDFHLKSDLTYYIIHHKIRRRTEPVGW